SVQAPVSDRLPPPTPLVCDHSPQPVHPDAPTAMIVPYALKPQDSLRSLQSFCPGRVKRLLSLAQHSTPTLTPSLSVSFVASFSLCNPHDILFTVKAVLEQASDPTQDTERITFHVERRWIEAIRRQADLDGL